MLNYGFHRYPCHLFSMLHFMPERCNAPIEGTFSRFSIDQEVIFSELPCAQRPCQTHTLIVVVTVCPIEGVSTVGTLEDAE